MTFYFYDLETSSGSPRSGRVMQFAGQRINELLEPIGEPDNILVKLPDDILPEPDAILVHGITPQQTLTDGMSEADFAAFFNDKIAQPNTVFVGYNNIRFDDEFMRLVCYRNFYDPYEWHWKDGKGRWDLLDAMRMMRALRPEGLEWPFADDGKPTVRLESMAKINGILHENAHDALSDVLALIELGRRFQTAQPKLFDYLVQTRDKKKVAKLAEGDAPFVYTSGKYDTAFHKTTVVKTLFRHPRREAALVYDLRHDPSEWIDKTAEELAKHWVVRYGDELKPLPVKTLQYNRCPAVAPFGVLDTLSKERIGFNDAFNAHAKILAENPDFIKKLTVALDILEKQQQTKLPLDQPVDNQIYDGFWVDKDRAEMLEIRMSDPVRFDELQTKIKNKRLRELMPLYVGRNFQMLMTPEQHEQWDERRRELFFKGGEKSQAARIYQRMQEIATTRKLSSNDEYLLAELQLYIESILPEPIEA